MNAVRLLTIGMFLLCGLFPGCAAEQEPPVDGESVRAAADSSNTPAVSSHDTPTDSSRTSSSRTSSAPRSDLPAEAELDNPTANSRAASSAGPATSNTPAEPPAVSFDKIKFKAADGEVRMSLKPEADGAKLVDADERELARYTLSGNKLKIKNAADETLGYIVAYPDRLKVKDAQQKNDLWQLRRQSDGDWKLEDAKGTVVCRVKKRDYGFEIETPDDISLQKVKLKDGKLSLRKSEETYLYTKDKMSPTAAACLALEPVESQPVRMGLATLMLLKFPSR